MRSISPVEQTNEADMAKEKEERQMQLLFPFLKRSQ